MSLGQRADRLLQDATSRGDVPGVVAAATTATETIYEGGFGERVLGKRVVMTPDTVVWIASMTKAITAVAAMQLVEQGKLDLDRPAGAVVEHLGEVEVLEGFDDAGQPVTRPPRQAITLRHLLTHTAGYAYEMWNRDVVRYQEAKGLPQIITCQNAALDTPLLFDPGDRWEYGINLDWVGKMVEAASGQTLGQYMKAHILDPLGMHDTAFTITPAMDARLAKIHARGADDSLAPIDLVLEQNPEFEMGGGGLYSTVGDYQKFESPDIKVGRSQRTGTTCAVSPAHLSSSNNHRLNTLRRLLAAAEQAPQPERGLRRRPSTEARKYCSGRSQKNP